MEFWLNIYIYVNMFIIGTLFGSFFTLATYRIPRKQDIVFKRSYCPNCNHELGFFDLIPVLSYIFVGGKCRYCKKGISPRYLLFEIFNGFVFLMLYLIFGFTIYFLAAIILYVYLFLITGCYIMNKKMIEEKISNIKKQEKKGVFLAELAIAFVVFAVLMTSAYITSRNYLNQSIETISKNNAVLEATKNIEIALATEYTELASFINNNEVDGINYETTVAVTDYVDEFPEKEDCIKIINAKVKYLLNGKSMEFDLNTIKKKVI